LTPSSASSTYLRQDTASSTYLTQSNAGIIYAPKNSPTFTGVPTAPTAPTSQSNAQIATTAYVKSQNYLNEVTASSTYLTQISADNIYLTKANGITGVNASAAFYAKSGGPISGDISVSGSANIVGDLNVDGNFIVSGSTTYINTETIELADNVIVLNSNETSTPTQNAGIEIERGTSPNVSIQWNESLDTWEYTTDGAIYRSLEGGAVEYAAEDPSLTDPNILTGTLWVESDVTGSVINANDYITKVDASAYATKIELEQLAVGEINLQTTINTASAAAFASASAYTDQEIGTIDLSEYLTIASASSTFAKKTNRWRKTYSFSGNESFTVTNSGAGAYVVGGVSNPTFNLVKGNTYTFVINASGHPFWIQTVSGGYSSSNVYSTGTTNLGTDNGTITWVIPTNAPDTLYYACQFHSSMQGTINLIDPLKISGVDDNSNTLSYNQGYELLYINGMLIATNQYTTGSSSLITLNEALSTNDVVDIIIGG
jgi:hypothetical protein